LVEELKLDLAAEVLTSFGQARLPVTGSSMFPCMQPGDMLEIRRPAGPLQTGDVVVYLRHARLVVHRVAGQTGDLLLTRGDRLRYPDAPVPAADILGCVASIERRGRRFAPRLTLFCRIASAVLRYTDFGTRAALYFARMVRA
jgi:signal peptidase I